MFEYYIERKPRNILLKDLKQHEEELESLKGWWKRTLLGFTYTDKDGIINRYRRRKYYEADRKDVIKALKSISLSREKIKKNQSKIKTVEKEIEELQILANIGLVFITVRRVVFDITKYDFDDLISEGYGGLLKAVRSFDESKGIKFASYAAICIERRILDYIKKENLRLGRELNPDNINPELEREKENREAFHRWPVDSDNTVENEIISKNPVLLENIRTYMTTCSELEQKIIELFIIMPVFYGLRGMTQQELADMFKVSQPTVSRTYSKILEEILFIIYTIDPSLRGYIDRIAPKDLVGKFNQRVILHNEGFRAQIMKLINITAHDINEETILLERVVKPILQHKKPISHRELAARLGISYTTIGKYEELLRSKFEEILKAHRINPEYFTVEAQKRGRKKNTQAS